MTIHHLEIFLQVCRLENITRAAESLHMTQPAVSVAIREMEKHYGVTLFERLGRRLYITQDGRELYARAVHIVEEFHQMEQGMGRSAGLRVGSSVTLGNVLIPRAVRRWTALHPEGSIRVTVANGTTLQQLLCDSLLDAAVIEGPVERPELEKRVFRRDDLVLVLPPEHPLAAEEHITLARAVEEPLLLREKGSLGRSFVDSTLERHGLTPNIAWESIDTLTLFRAVEAGLGVAFLPRELAESQPGVVFRRICDEPFSRVNVLTWHRHKRISPALRDWMSLLEQSEAL